MCNREPSTLADYQESVSVATIQSRVAMQGMTDMDVDATTPAESQTVGTSVQVQTSILAEADKVAGENRSRDYGHPLANHRRIADIWNVQLEKKLAAPLTPKDVAVLMIGLKLARLINSPNHHDSFVDIVGYVKCWDMMDQAGAE